MPITRRLRYEILRRDSYTCRYCGAKAPDTTITIDHVIPVALGGQDEPSNLVTACTSCNAGKSSVPPDAPLIDQVSDDDLRWARAMIRAADVLEGQMRDLRALQKQFLDRWDSYEPPAACLPTDWPESVAAFLRAGLPMPVLLDCIDIAMSRSHVTWHHTWRYMCGIAWKKVGELQAVARDLIEAETTE